MSAAPDLIARLRELLTQRADLPADVWAPIEADLRREFGGREHYVRRRTANKTDHLRRLADLPPDASEHDRCTAAGLSARRMYELWSLLDK